MVKVPSVALLCGLLVAAAGCGSEPELLGDQMRVYFPFDGTRTWSFISTNQSISYKVIATLEPARGQVGSEEYPIRYTKRCVGNDPSCVDGEWLYTQWWRYSSGAFMTAFDSPEGNTFFDPPLQFTTDRMVRTDTVETNTGGATWTVEFVGKEPCPSRWNAASLPDCVRMTASGGTSAVAMTYFFVPDWMLGGFQWGDSPDTWQIERATYSPEAPVVEDTGVVNVD